MINQLEIPMYLEDAIPEISHDLESRRNCSAYDVMNTLTAFTCQSIDEHNYNVVRRCFQAADKLYSKGNTMVKNAVENVFVYSFSKMFNAYPAEKKQLFAIIPITLYTLYIAQVYRKGC